MSYNKKNVEDVLKKARAINKRTPSTRRHANVYTNRNNPGVVIEVIEQAAIVLKKARALNERVPSSKKCAPIYDVPTQAIKLKAQSTDSEELEEFELLFTRNPKF
ncbi:hypothetical protein ACIQFL_19290 [Bacillus toyonensis]|uniref:hypothetical protein n=1 Tax=Bacillus toyonensis TaxID=155322 RepID=UPI0037F8E810